MIKNIEKTIHSTWEEKGLQVIGIEAEIKQMEEEITEVKVDLKDQLAAQKIDVYQGRDVILTRRLSPKQYGVVFETAIKYASLKELAEAGVLGINLKSFQGLLQSKNITLSPGEYLELRGAVEYLTVRKK